MSMLARLRPPARAARRSAAPDVAGELVETAIDCDAAALALAECLERRNAAIGAAMKAGVIPAALGARAQRSLAVTEGIAATGLAQHCGIEAPPAAEHRSFIEQARELLIARNPK